MTVLEFLRDITVLSYILDYGAELHVPLRIWMTYYSETEEDVSEAVMLE
jgi:hypothetical protein